jgi:UDP-N-acetylmuramyl pentapeptide phosphotransferase/UDP-N-acetylglucosamine-1-phosphate transferase/O-antigen ligase
MLQPSVVEAATFLVTFACCLALVLTTRWHGRLSLDTTVGLQKFHSSPTPRIGGLATLAGLVAGYAVAPEPVRQLLGPLLVASLPAFGAGLLEDVTKAVGIRARLLGTIFSGVVAWYLTGMALTKTGVPGLDDLLAFAPVATLFTAVALGGMANAVNIIDGFNGLAGGVLSVMFVALGIIAARAGDQALAGACWALAACSIAFTLVNWPFGKIFLGDGGAYQLGFAVGWIAILLVGRNPEVPAWAPLTVCAYPVLEVAFSVVRKSRRAGYHPGQPDRVHLHMLLHRRVVRAWLPAVSRTWQNALTSPFAWLYAALLAAWGIAFARDSVLLMAGLVAAALAYASIYTRLTRFRWWTVPAPGRKAVHVRAVDLPLGHLNASAGSLASLVPFGGHLPTREPSAIQWHPRSVGAMQAMPASRWAVAGYGILGLSTCLTFIEPAPFELIAFPLVLASWIRHVLSRSRSYTPSSAALVLLLALFSLLQLLPVGAARNLVQAAEYAAVTALLIMIGIHLGRLFGTGDVRFRAFARCYCLVALLSALVAIASLYLAETRAVPEWLFTAGRPRAFFKDPNVLGPYLVPAVLAFLYKAGQSRSLARVVHVACALLCALGVIATASRGAWVNLAVAIAVYTLLGRRRGIMLAAVTLLGLTVVAAMGVLAEWAPNLFELFSERTQLQDYDADRFLVARQAWELGWRYPLGVGPGDITGYTGFDAMAPHNTYARIWAENGPAALILFVLIVAAAWISTFQAWLRVRAGAGGALAVALALLMGMLINASVVDALHWRHFWVIMCLCIFSSHSWRRTT